MNNLMRIFSGSLVLALVVGVGCTTPSDSVESETEKTEQQEEPTEAPGAAEESTSEASESGEEEDEAAGEDEEADVDEEKEQQQDGDVASQWDDSNCEEIDSERFQSLLLEKDLNDNGHPDRVYEEQNTCGTGSCNAVVFRNCGENTYEPISTIGHWDGVSLGDEVSNGWRELQTTHTEMDEMGDPRPVTDRYLFDGEQYERVQE